MAVYTFVSADEISAFLEHYDLGALVSFEPIAQGVSNSNYHLYTKEPNGQDLHTILTIFEPRRVDESRVDFFLAYPALLSSEGIPSGKAMVRKDGDFCGELAGKKAAILNFLEGNHPARIDADLCRSLGAFAAHMHKASAGASGLSNDYSIAKWKLWHEAMRDDFSKIDAGILPEIEKALESIEADWPEDDSLPRGLIHGDLFPDNIFISKENKNTICGVIDFHFVCEDFLIYDFAIILNAWAFSLEGDFRKEHYYALLKGYEFVRPLEKNERRILPLMLRAAALRFLLSRCEEKLAYREGDAMQPHDPLLYLKRLKFFHDMPACAITGRDDV